MKTSFPMLVLAFLALALMGCSKDEEATPNKWLNDIATLYELNTDKITVEEGFAGTLTLIEGNCMPIITEESTCKEYPVQRAIVVYPYTTRQEATVVDNVYYTLQGKPLLTVEADAEGFYQAQPPPGTYSVFIRENGKLYANGLDGQGGINPVQVQQNQVSSINLSLNYAVY